MPRTMKEKMYSISNLPIVTASDNSGNEWSFVDGYRIVNGSSVLYNKDIRMSQYASEIKYIHAGKSRQFAWGL